MSINKSRNVSILRTSSSKNAKIIQPTSLKTIDLLKRNPSKKEIESKDMITKLHTLQKDTVQLKALLKESEKIMQTSTSKSHQDARAYRQIIEGIWPSIEAKITDEQKNKLREALQAMEETMGKPSYSSIEIQCDEHCEAGVFTTGDKFQSELSKQKQMVEDSGLSLQTLDKKIAESENSIQELSREMASYIKFIRSSHKTIGIPTFMYLLK